MTTAITIPFDGPSAVFTGADICREAGLPLPDGSRRPLFEGDIWDFNEVIGLPVQLPICHRHLDFTGIRDLRWRLVAKELLLAMLAPRHPAVATLPRAHRTALHLRSCVGRLDELTRLFQWLGNRSITSLEMLDTHLCEAYLAHRRYVLDEHGTIVGEQSPGTRRAAAQAVVDLVNYRDLFTADRVAADLRPWGGATASAIAEMPSGRTENKTRPVEDGVLQPMLAAALYLVDMLGPRAVQLAHAIQDADQYSARRLRGLRKVGAKSKVPAHEISRVLGEYTDTCTPLPMLEDWYVTRRLGDGWDPHDPLLHVATGTLARQAGLSQFATPWLTTLRRPLEDALAQVGVDKPFGQGASHIPAADGRNSLPWTRSLHRLEAVALVGIVRTAAIVTTPRSPGCARAS